MQTKILCLCGSSRRDSLNQKLLEIAALGATREGGAATHMRLRDYPLLMYDGDMETAGKIGLFVIPDAFALGRAHEAFDEWGQLKDPTSDQLARHVGAALVRRASACTKEFRQASHEGIHSGDGAAHAVI